ncbi:MAG: hypothetical protein ACQEP9_05465 [Bacillota bacterium]
MVNYTESDLAFYQALKKIVGKVGNGHTKTVPDIKTDKPLDKVIKIIN